MTSLVYSSSNGNLIRDIGRRVLGSLVITLTTLPAVVFLDQVSP